MDSSTIAMAVPVFFLMIGVEAWIAHRRRAGFYRLSDSVNSLSCGMTQQSMDVVLKLAGFGIYAVVYEHLALFALDAGSVLVWVLGAFAVDLLYYCFHRASHRVNALWAGHIVHHQSEEYNLTTALRQSALGGMMSALFYWPLALIGLPPLVFFTLSTFNTLYQFWIHTRLIGRLGPLEWALNTPSHHRVHHGIDPKYIDKNYGGILIIWDRMFGTFQAEEEEPAYGTVKPLSSWNPIWANVEPWWRMIAMARSTRRVADKLRIFVAPPEWRPADLGGPVTIPEVDRATRVKYGEATPRGLSLYVAAQLALVTLSLLWVLVSYRSAPPLETALLVGWIAAGLLTCGGLLEAKRWATTLDLVRLLSAPALAAIGTGPAPWMSLSWAVLCVASALWLAVRTLSARRSAARVAVVATSPAAEP